MIRRNFLKSLIAWPLALVAGKKIVATKPIPALQTLPGWVDVSEFSCITGQIIFRTDQAWQDMSGWERLQECARQRGVDLECKTTP